MPRLSIVSPAEAEALTVDLWGTEYTRVPVTRSRQRELKKLEVKLTDIDENAADADDKAVEAMGRMLDQILLPPEGSEKASALIVEKWKADELTFGRLSAFIEELGEASADPT